MSYTEFLQMHTWEGDSTLYKIMSFGITEMKGGYKEIRQLAPGLVASRHSVNAFGVTIKLIPY